MRSFGIVSLVLFSLALSVPAQAFVPLAGDSVQVTEAIKDDLYAAAGTVDVSAPIDGDLTAAGGTVAVSGRISGAILTMGGTVWIAGGVGRNVRAVGGTVTLTGPIGTDAVLAGGTVRVNQSARVGRDLVAAGGNLELHGTVARDVLVTGGNVVIGGRVAGDVDVDADRLTVLSTARITGRLNYQTARPAEIQQGAQIEGGARQVGTRRPGPGPMRRLGFPFGRRLLEALWLLALGVVALAVFPTGTLRVVERIDRRFGMSLLTGFLILVAVPVAVVLVMITIIGIPLGVAALLVYIAMLYPVQVFPVLWMGERLLRLRRTPRAASPYLTLLIGTVVFVILLVVPVLGWIIRLVAVMVGFGALWSVIWSGRTRPFAATPA